MQRLPAGHPTSTSSSFSLHRSAPHRDPLSFPTRRSSDLIQQYSFRLSEELRSFLRFSCRHTVAVADEVRVDEIGRAHVELQSPCNLVCRLLLEKKNNRVGRTRKRRKSIH